ncbi:MAG: 50S ribosomal protein L7/L12 [Chlamydiae bacterium]|nr:50S ribosomal protein L7/L12 [Chlamydiota bacterium]
MSQQLDQIVETLSQLTVLDLANLKKMLEDKWGVQAAAAAVAMPVAAAAAAPAVEESTEFNVYIKESPADKKIGIIKAVREATGLGLGEAKAFVEAADATKPVKEKIKKAEADELKKKLEEAGAKVEVKGV